MGIGAQVVHEERGLAAGIIAAGFGGGTAFLFVPVIASLIKSDGYKTAFLYTGIFQGS